MTMPALAPAGTLPLASETTVRDLHLAEALGFKRPANIRNLIKRHHEILEAIGPLLHREAMVDIGSGAKRAVTEFHLTKAQAAFIIGKSDTEKADSVLALISEVFAMAAEGRLVAADAAAAKELHASTERAAVRHGLIAAEEREARDSAFKLFKSGTPAPAKPTPGAKPNWHQIHLDNQRKERLRLSRLASSGRAASRKTFNGDVAS